ncbi:MAG TPA: DUF1501 domain-containing protein [Allosphingosinicella sp.]
MIDPKIDRRRFLSLAASAGALLITPRIGFAAVETDYRFLFVIQRGGADGLDLVIPYADPNYARYRGAIAIDPAHAIKLDGSFALHPSLAGIGGLYRSGEALFLHAVATPYRERSHFDGQNVLETGGGAPYQVKDGWLNRLAGLLPKSSGQAVAFAPTVPMALRGPAIVTSHAPSNLPEAPDDLLARVGSLYAADEQLHPLWSVAMTSRGPSGGAVSRRDPASLGKLVAAFLSRPNGPRIAMLETGGWDTHSQQTGRLAGALTALDRLIVSLKDNLGPVWDKTAVVVATEFGRTAAANGTGGTDHGTASAAMLLGGAVKGGRIVADWPGLAQSSLYEARDLRPTLALDAVFATAAAETLRLEPELVARTLFPGNPVRLPVSDLIRRTS